MTVSMAEIVQHNVATVVISSVTPRLGNVAGIVNLAGSVKTAGKVMLIH